MHAPTRGELAERASEMNIRKSRPGIFAICPRISPRIREQKRPIAIWLRASTTYFRKNFFTMMVA
jgi:hypothetical protein